MIIMNGNYYFEQQEMDLKEMILFKNAICIVQTPQNNIFVGFTSLTLNKMMDIVDVLECALGIGRGHKINIGKAIQKQFNLLYFLCVVSVL